jgi:hypothetical protein
MFEGIRRTGTYFFPPTSANFFCSEMLKAVLPVAEADFRISTDACIQAWTGLLGQIKAIDL